jgi:hypothetical protein
LEFLRAWRVTKDFNKAIGAQRAHDHYSRAIWDNSAGQSHN